MVLSLRGSPWMTVYTIVESRIWPTSAITWKQCEIRYKLLLITNRKSHVGFRLVSKLVTLNSVMALTEHYFTEFDSFCGWLHQSGWGQTYTVCDKSVAKESSFSDISFIAIFTEVTENEHIIDRHVYDKDTLRNSLWGTGSTYENALGTIW